MEHREISDEVSVNGEQSALEILVVKILLRTYMSIAPSHPKSHTQRPMFQSVAKRARGYGKHHLTCRTVLCMMMLDHQAVIQVWILCQRRS